MFQKTQENICATVLLCNICFSYLFYKILCCCLILSKRFGFIYCLTQMVVTQILRLHLFFNWLRSTVFWETRYLMLFSESWVFFRSTCPFWHSCDSQFLYLNFSVLTQANNFFCTVCCVLLPHQGLKIDVRLNSPSCTIIVSGGVVWLGPWNWLCVDEINMAEFCP